MKSKYLVTTIIILSLMSIFVQFSSTGFISESSGYKGELPVVIFDTAHQQIFDNTHMQSALDMIELEFEATIIINTERFTLTNLRGADLVILPAPNYQAESPFTDLEEMALKEYILDGGTVLFLANPFLYETNLRNYSSNVVAINDMMSEPTTDAGDSLYGALNFEQGYNVLMNDFQYLYDDERILYLDKTSFVSDHPLIAGKTADDQVNEIITITTMITTISGQKVINTTANSYAIDYTQDDDDEDVYFGAIASGSVKNQTILAAEEIYESRGISCGSAIMFSDLVIPGSPTNMTWFEAYDNAKLWKNMINWLFFKTPIEEKIAQIADFWIFALIILGAFILLISFGSISFTAGKEVKKVEVSETIQKMRLRDERKQRDDKDIEKAFYAEDIDEKDHEEEVEHEEDKELDMKSISDELKKKPPKTRSRSERRRRS